MDAFIAHRILDLLENARKIPEYRQLAAEHEILNTRLLSQLETMTPAQQSAVMDYIGLCIELHLTLLSQAMVSGGP